MAMRVFAVPLLFWGDRKHFTLPYHSSVSCRLRIVRPGTKSQTSRCCNATQNISGLTTPGFGIRC